ncbi:MAG TPA: serine hydrolase domain-containing protein, partial [Gemmatimonadota bacterium]|nr:serine hydrolase domain-containing protein [Gemmatimonadota bacterium]
EGRTVWLEGLGWADIEGRRPVDPRTTRFRVYSVSKGLTTLAAASLVEDGRLDPGAPVRRYVPDFPDKGTPITSAELLAHTSGIRHYRDEAEASSRRHCETVADALPIFEDDPLVHPPGTARTYSSWGYVLLSRVLEAAGGAPYPDVVRRRVLGPAGAGRTVIDDPRERVPARAVSYAVPEGGPPEPAPPVDNTCKWGAGAYLSTASDLLAVYRAALDGALIDVRTFRAMILPGAGPDPAGRHVLEVSGWGTGAAAFTAADLDDGVVVVLLSNAIGPAYGPRVQRAFGRLRGLFDPGG